MEYRGRQTDDGGMESKVSEKRGTEGVRRGESERCRGRVGERVSGVGGA